MQDSFLYIICSISILVAMISLYVSIRVAKNAKVSNENIHQLHMALSALLSPAHGQHYVVAYTDEDFHEYEVPPNSFNKDDKVIDLFSREALVWNETLGDWVPKSGDWAPEDND